MVKYLVVTDPITSEKLGALCWDGTTLRAWGACNQWPTIDRQPPGTPFVQRIAEGPLPLSLLLQQGSYSRGWRVRNLRASDDQATEIVAELDGYEYRPKEGAQ